MVRNNTKKPLMGPLSPQEKENLKWRISFAIAQAVGSDIIYS